MKNNNINNMKKISPRPLPSTEKNIIKRTNMGGGPAMLPIRPGGSFSSRISSTSTDSMRSTLDKDQIVSDISSTGFQSTISTPGSSFVSNQSRIAPTIPKSSEIPKVTKSQISETETLVKVQTDPQGKTQIQISSKRSPIAKKSGSLKSKSNSERDAADDSVKPKSRILNRLVKSIRMPTETTKRISGKPIITSVAKSLGLDEETSKSSKSASSRPTSGDHMMVVREVRKSVSGSLSSQPPAKTEMISAKIVKTVTVRDAQEKRRDEREEFLHDCAIHILAQLLALSFLVLMTLWLLQYFGGFAKFWILESLSEQIFNYHPLMMSLGCIYLLSNTLLFLTPKRKLSLLRILAQLLVISMAIIGILATVYWHIKNNVNHLFTLHSWFGVLTIIMLPMYIGGHMYLFYKTPSSGTIGMPTKKQDPQKEVSFEQHLLGIRVFGIATLIMATITSLLGLNQMVAFLRGRQFYLSEGYSSQRLLVNIIAIFLLIYVAFMIYMASRRKYRSKEREELEERIQMALDEAMAKLEKAGAFEEVDQDQQKLTKVDVKNKSPKRSQKSFSSQTTTTKSESTSRLLPESKQSSKNEETTDIRKSSTVC